LLSPRRANRAEIERYVHYPPPGPGAFKFRGACNMLTKLEDATAARGVVTHSSGNHAGALALAARMRVKAKVGIVVDSWCMTSQRLVAMLPPESATI
jgi:hypothetical protein